MIAMKAHLNFSLIFLTLILQTFSILTLTVTNDTTSGNQSQTTEIPVGEDQKLFTSVRSTNIIKDFSNNFQNSSLSENELNNNAGFAFNEMTTVQTLILSNSSQSDHDFISNVTIPKIIPLEVEKAKSSNISRLTRLLPLKLIPTNSSLIKSNLSNDISSKENTQNLISGSTESSIHSTQLNFDGLSTKTEFITEPLAVNTSRLLNDSLSDKSLEQVNTTKEKIPIVIEQNVSTVINNDTNRTFSPIVNNTIEEPTNLEQVTTNPTTTMMVESITEVSLMPSTEETEKNLDFFEEFNNSKNVIDWSTEGVTDKTTTINILEEMSMSTTTVDMMTTEENLSTTAATSQLSDDVTSSIFTTDSTESTTKTILTSESLDTNKQIITDMSHPTTISYKNISTNDILKYSSTIPTIITTKSEDEYIIQTTEKMASTFVPGIKINTETDEMDSSEEPDYIWIAITVSIVGLIALFLLVFVSCFYLKRRNKFNYGQRCRPVSLDAYSLDNISVHNSVRRREKNALRASKKSYGNVAFDDPSLKHNPMGVNELAKFVDKKLTIYDEFKGVPQIYASSDEVPTGCETKNRYANVIPLPETRVMLGQEDNNPLTTYINANYVRGPKDPPNYYIACQAPLESTTQDFWRMIWEQNSNVIVMATDIEENGVEKCYEYFPPSITDNHSVFGNFQITLKSREVKEKYAVSIFDLKNTVTNLTREINHFWYKWPEVGVPSDVESIIAMLLEARSCLKFPNEISDVSGLTSTTEINGNIDRNKSKTQGPLVVHCSPGTGRTGTIVCCDIAIRGLEQTKRNVNIPQFVYYIRRGRASSVQTKEQYELIYKVSHSYATKISRPLNDN